ncbi:hypothetical protein HYALB_00011142 [Hymenoscyphus albidus]|uniref:J domain-containing protein n=1 Tax=Hymenoscyphus albidus TaxID=595503 RepID=A0A9N9LPC8_9HELO|nr:hypothetical protein HYALB_00011142 [Hymenoscyphus albidus]
MANNDLLKFVTSEVDFYDLLGLTFEDCSPSTLRRAYRKTALKYHPDKVGTSFDPEKYELFQAANDILSDPELKSKYDNHRNARVQRQRANELFEGKRRQMKEDLEARERGGVSAGMKRQREEEGEMGQELRRLAEEGRKRRAARQSMMAENFKVDTSSSIPSAPRSAPLPKQHEKSSNFPQAGENAKAEEPQEEDEVERLERRIREAEQAKALKAQRKAEKRARKSGVFVPLDSPAPKSESKAGSSKWEADQGASTPIKRPDIFKGLKADEKSSASPKFSFSPNTTPAKNDFSATMARLKAAEKMKLEEIRQRESETAG